MTRARSVTRSWRRRRDIRALQQGLITAVESPLDQLSAPQKAKRKKDQVKTPA